MLKSRTSWGYVQDFLTHPGPFWSSVSSAPHVNTAFSNNATQRSCRLKLSLFPHAHISVGSNSGSLWGVISERTHWFEGLGGSRMEGGRVDENEWGRHARGSAAFLRHPPISSAGAEGAQQTRRLEALMSQGLKQQLMASPRPERRGSVAPFLIFLCP